MDISQETVFGREITSITKLLNSKLLNVVIVPCYQGSMVKLLFFANFLFCAVKTHIPATKTQFSTLPHVLVREKFEFEVFLKILATLCS